MVEMLIAGKRTEGHAGEKIAVVDPAPEETIEHGMEGLDYCLEDTSVVIGGLE